MSATSNLNDNSFKSTHGSHGRRTTRIVSCNRNTSAIFGKKTFRLFLKTQKLTLLRLSFSESTEMAELLRYMARKWPSCYDIWHGNGRVVTIYGTEMAELLRYMARKWPSRYDLWSWPVSHAGRGQPQDVDGRLTTTLVQRTVGVTRTRINL